MSERVAVLERFVGGEQEEIRHMAFRNLIGKFEKVLESGIPSPLPSVRIEYPQHAKITHPITEYCLVYFVDVGAVVTGEFLIYCRLLQALDGARYLRFAPTIRFKAKVRGISPLLSVPVSYAEELVWVTPHVSFHPFYRNGTLPVCRRTSVPGGLR